MNDLSAAFAKIECEIELENEEMEMRDYAEQKYTGGPVSASPFDRLSDAVAQLRGADAEVARIADRIAGPLPENAGASLSKEASIGGLIDGMERSTGDIIGAVDRILSSVKRIESRL